MSDSPSSSYYDPSNPVEVKRITEITGQGFDCIGSPACLEMADFQYEIGLVALTLCRWHEADWLEIYQDYKDAQRRSWADFKAREAAREDARNYRDSR